MKKSPHLSGFRIGFLLTVISLIIFYLGIPFLELVELKAYDLHFKSGGKDGIGHEVAIVSVDEKSIDRLGRWPWPRSVMAELVESLKKYGAAVVAFDIVFSEPDNTSGLKYYKELKDTLTKKGYKVSSTIDRFAAEKDNDALLASAIKKNPAVILGYYFYTTNEEIAHRKDSAKARENEIYPKPISIIRDLDGRAVIPDIITTKGIEENIALLSNTTEDFGFFNIVPDIDGTIRRVPLVMEHKGEYYPHLSLEAVRKFVDSPLLTLNLAEYGVDSIMLGDHIITTDERGMALINYRGPKRTFPHYSISDVISGEVPEKALKDKIVLIGATATGIYDLRVTPSDIAFPGIELHASIIDNILGGDFIYRPDWIIIFDVLIILILGVALSIFIPRFQPLYAAITIFVISAVYISINNLLFTYMNMWLTVVYPIFTTIFVAGGVTVFQYITEEKKKREIKSAFSHYVAPSLVDIVVNNPEILKLGGEEKRLTVLFSDIRGFTSVSEGLKPQALVRLMNDYLTPMTDVVFDNDGTVDKFMGDAIMAFWGAPVEQPDHAFKACRAALEMMKKLKELQPLWKEHGIEEIDIGIGLSTGKVTVGNMGSLTRFDYTVIGDSINLGSRLEGLNKEYKTHIIVTKYTHLDVEDDFIFRELDMVRVKGKARHISIFELMGDKEHEGEFIELKKTFDAGLKLYREQDWDGAERYFKKCLEIEPDDGPSQVFLSRIITLKEQDLPKDWDGIYVMTGK